MGRKESLDRAVNVAISMPNSEAKALFRLMRAMSHASGRMYGRSDFVREIFFGERLRALCLEYSVPTPEEGLAEDREDPGFGYTSYVPSLVPRTRRMTPDEHDALARKRAADEETQRVVERARQDIANMDPAVRTAIDVEMAKLRKEDEIRALAQQQRRAAIKAKMDANGGIYPDEEEPSK